MPRYCDVNNDKKITLSEWLNCLQVHTNVQATKLSEASMYFSIEAKKNLTKNPLNNLSIRSVFS